MHLTAGNVALQQSLHASQHEVCCDATQSCTTAALSCRADASQTCALQALCTNDSVLKLGALSRINERCLDMLSAKPAKKQATGNAQRPKVHHT